MPRLRGNALSPRQKSFLNHYLKTKNATQSAIMAGYSKRTADVQGSRLLGNVTIKGELAKREDKAEELAVVSRAEIIAELKRLAFLDIAGAFDAEGRLKPIEEIPEDIRRAIAGLENTELAADGIKLGSIKKIKLLDKIRALELLGKTLTMFTDKIEIGVTEQLADRLARAFERTNGTA